MDDTRKGIGIVYCAILFAYWEYISHVDMSPESLDTHLWIFACLLFFGVLAWAAVAGARRRS
jgi:uncharacterized membrane protein